MPKNQAGIPFMHKFHQSTICVIGAAIMDIMGFPFASLQTRDSVPGNVLFTPGGVGRNIAENLGRLSLPTQFISIFGTDWFSQQLVQSLAKVDVNTSHSHFVGNQSAATHLAIQDQGGDMRLGIAQLEILQHFTTEFVEKKLPVIAENEIIVLETNLEKNIIEFLLEQLPAKQLFLDPVSATMALKVKAHIHRFHTLKANYLEAEVLSGIKIKDDGDLRKTAQFFLSKGVKRVFITQGKKGLFYADEEDSGQIPAPPVKVINTTGAGDALFAGIIWASYKNASTKHCAEAGLLAASVAVQHLMPVSPEMKDDIFTNLS